jgi:glycosyltransferase involved in cell wall biosynthesis
VPLNRRLAHELSRAGGDQWEVTVAGPESFHGDLRPVTFAPDPGEPCRLEPIQVRGDRRIHTMTYNGRLRGLMNERWDVIHAWEEPFVLAGGQLAWQRPSATRLVFATFQNISKRYPPPFCWIERYALQRAAGWIAFGQLVEQTLVNRPGYRDRPRRMIPVGVDTVLFRPDTERRRAIREQWGWSEAGPPVIGYLGRLTPEKGLPLLMDVLDDLTVPWRFACIGTGPLDESLRQWMTRHGDRVRLLTDVEHQAVPAVLNGCDLLVAPSQTTPRWREQLGRMILEAFASGVPVVASDSGEIPFVVADAGMIVAEADRGAWRLAIEQLLDSPEGRHELARRGRERAEQVFDWKIVARQHLQFFNELLDHQPVTA